MSGFFHSVLKMSSEEVNSVLLQACHRLPGVVKNKRPVKQPTSAGRNIDICYGAQKG